MNIFVEMPNNAATASFMTSDNISFLNSLGNVTWNRSDKHLSKEDFRAALRNADVCVCGWSVPSFDSYVLKEANHLKLVAYVAGSVNGVATDEMYEKGIRIVSGNNVFAQSVAEGTLTYMLAALRQLSYYESVVRQGGWHDGNFSNRSLLGKKVGIVGLGTISKYLIQMLKPFDTDITVYSRHTTQQEAEELGIKIGSLKDVFMTSDIISLHCARSASNYHLVDDTLLSMMKPGALLVNTSRGDVVDETALVKYLLSGNIHAALDVFEVEPLPQNSPLRQLENVLLQPHLGGPTMDRRPAAAKAVLDDIQRLQEGLPLLHEISQRRMKTMSK